MDKIGEIIKNRRIKLGLTQLELAQKIDVSAATINRYESGEIKNLRRDKISKLAEALDLDPMVFVNENIGSISFNRERIDRAILKALNEVERINVDGKKWTPVPIYGVIKAGEPSLANNEVIGFEYFNVDNSEEYFSLRVSGDSMCGARICDGDLVLIKKQSDALDGEIVAVLIDGQDSTLKRIKYSAAAISFIADNPKYEPIIVTYAKLKEDPDYIRILGVVKSLVVKF